MRISIQRYTITKVQISQKISNMKEVMLWYLTKKVKKQFKLEVTKFYQKI